MELFGGYTTADLLKSLPRKLTTLRLKRVSGDFSAHVGDLPRGLKRLIIEEADVDRDSAEHWPRTLTEVILPGFTPVASHLHLLPLHLQHACFGSNWMPLSSLITYGPYDRLTRELVDPNHTEPEELLDPLAPEANPKAHFKKDRCVIS